MTTITLQPENLATDNGCRQGPMHEVEMDLSYTNGHRDLRASTVDLTQDENDLLQDELEDIKHAVLDERTVSHLSSKVESGTENAKLMEALAKFFNNYFTPCTVVKPSQIATAASGTAALDALLSDICEQGDGVLIPAGSGLQGSAWSYISAVEVDMSRFFTASVTKLPSVLAEAMDRAQLQCNIKALVLTNPHKMRGQCYPQEILECCLKFCQQRNIHFISDEEYALTEFSSAEVSELVPFVSVMSLNTRVLKCDRSRIHVLWSINTDFGASGFKLGCIVTQDNPKLAVRLGKSRNCQISSLSALFTTSLLSSPNLPFLISLNSARLAEAYISITRFLRERKIKYIPVSAGLNIFAKLAPAAKTRQDEDLMVAKLADAGVLVNPGYQYHARPPGQGWVRMTFSVNPMQLEDAMDKIEHYLNTALAN